MKNKIEIKQEEKSDEIKVPIGGFAFVIAKRGERISGFEEKVRSKPKLNKL